MSEPLERPKWNTAPLWGILLVFLLIGTLGGATFVYGVLGIVGGNAFGMIPLVAGGLVAFLAFLFLAGILYRVDRYRGANHRKVKLFE